VEDCSHRTPYKIPGCLVNHLVSNHGNEFPSKDQAKPRADILFALEMQATLTRGIDSTTVQESVAYEEFEDGEYEEFEEKSGSVFGASLPFVGIQSEEPLATFQPPVLPPRQLGASRRRAASLPTRQQAQSSPARPPQAHITFPGLSVTLIIYDLETTGYEVRYRL